MAHILILGGGLAGAAAALRLADAGHSATIVEARARLGGRGLSRSFGGTMVEFGGGWVNAGQARVMALAARLGCALVPRAGMASHRFLRDGGLWEAPYGAGEAAGWQAGMAAWARDAAEARAEVLGLTLAGWFAHRGVSPAVQREILAWWTITGSGDPAVVPVGELMTAKTITGFGPKLEELQYTFAEGVQGLVEAAARASGAKMLLGEPVEWVTSGTDGARVMTAAGRVLTGDAVLVALGVGALDQLRLDPPLPALQGALRRQGHAGRALKLLIRAKGVEPGHLVTGEGGGLRWLWSDKVLAEGGTLIVGFALAQDMPEPELGAVAAVVAQAFPGARVLGMDWHDWGGDPFARGTWVSPRAGTEGAYAADLWLGPDRRAFATSDLAPEAAGWFEGALASAEYATDYLMKALT